MADRTRIIEYKDFSGGDWGTREAWNAPANSFSALNMLVYRTGELGVRPGVKVVTPSSGVTTGDVTGLYEGPGPERGVIYTQGSKSYYFNPSTPPANGASASAASFSSAPTFSSFTKVGDTVFVISNDGVAQITSGNTLTRLTAAPASAAHGALFGEVFALANAGGTQSRVEFSDATIALNTWPGAVNRFNVGNTLNLTAMYSQRSALQIMTSGGIYVVTGTLNADTAAFALRKTSARLGPASAWSSCLTVDDIIWYVEGRGTYPASYDGTNFRVWDTINIPMLGDENVTAGVAPFKYPYTNDVVFLAPYQTGAIGEFLATAWVRLRGVWTKHQFPATVDPGSGNTQSGRLASYSSNYLADPGASLALAHNFRPTTTFVFTDDGAVGANPVFWGWSPDLNRPGSETDLIATYTSLGFAPERAGDASASQVEGQVSFPEWHADDDSEALVRTVTVDFRKWNTGGSDTNHFDIAVDALRRYNNTSPLSSTTLSWDEAGSLASTDGTIERVVFSFGDQGYGNGFQLHLTNIRGIAIQRIKVHAELRAAR